jgi:hypothetical protein
MNKTINFPTFIASFDKNSSIGDMHTVTLNTCEFVKIGGGEFRSDSTVKVQGFQKFSEKLN